MARILVVEDDPIIRQTVAYALKRAGFEVLSSGDGIDGLSIARSEQPDLIVLDLMLPGIDGYRFAEEVRRANSEVAIIMVTALDGERDTVRGLDAGADDYITKPFSMDELLARVRANLRRVRERSVLETDEPIAVGDLTLEPSQLRVTVSGAPIKLRLKEFQLLLALARNDGQLMSRQRLAREVWGYEFLPSSRTIDVHIRRLRQALEERSAFRYIQTVHGVGYRFEPVPAEASNADGDRP
ncbi:MAG: response regulator transcription factor [Coriobacteriia bacterium]|nr:response regulator transcription factor [Coriobacteriia bacterium]MBN2839688.1 response regulator transcription factor [Coriobacteriia bacterium]